VPDQRRGADAAEAFFRAAGAKGHGNTLLTGTE
jgi:hypothetical protein